MKNLNMFCITLEPDHYKFIKKLGYTPAGLGNKNFSSEWLSDKSGINISEKNKNYAECTFHYWIWKNYIDKLNSKWIGFCGYRKFWGLRDSQTNNKNINNINTKVLKEIPKEFENYESILGEPMFVNQFRPMKFIKKGFKIFLKKPFLFFDKTKRNLNFHFDLLHGEGILNDAINLLDQENKNDFRKFVNTEVSFNPWMMFICKSKGKLKNYYEVLFPWLEKCEKLYGPKKLRGYEVRICAFLAERFLPYWFQKYTKYTTMPVFFYDIRKEFKSDEIY